MAACGGGLHGHCAGGGFWGAAWAVLQLGVGVSRGPEIFAAAVRLALEEHRDDPSWVYNSHLDFIKINQINKLRSELHRVYKKQCAKSEIDFKNAFNEVSRLPFLRFCAAHFPALLLFLLAAYGAPAYVTDRSR